VHVAGGPAQQHRDAVPHFLYAKLELDFVYKAFTTTDLAAAIAGIRALGIRGCGVSMPFKEACIELVEEMDGSAEAIRSVNTIVNTDGQLRAYNTDYLAIAKLLAGHQVPVDHTFAVLGSGGMAKAVVAALRDAGFHAGTVVARNARTGAALADQYGYAWRGEVGASRPQLLVNATPLRVGVHSHGRTSASRHLHVRQAQSSVSAAGSHADL
jgi:shikimate dehydrogenase